MSNHSYKIKEEKEDWKDTVISKEGVVVDFTIRQFEENIERMQKVLRELEGTHKINLATVENIERNHGWIKKMKPEELHTASMYWEAKQIVLQYAPRIAEFYEALNIESKEMEDVKKQFNFNNDEGTNTDGGEG